ncbi:hypothetical protein FRB97_003565, partial [Tulasnella sp. 331]
MSAQDLTNAMDGLNGLTQSVTNSALQPPFKTTLNGVTSSACRVIRLAGTVKKNKNDAKALALYISDITERSIRGAVSLSNDGVVGDTLITNLITWKRYIDEVAGELKELTGLIVFKYTDDRLKIPTFNTRVGSIVSLILPAVDLSATSAQVLPEPTTGPTIAAATNTGSVTPEPRIIGTSEQQPTSDHSPSLPNSEGAPRIALAPEVASRTAPSSEAMPTQSKKPDTPVPEKSKASKTSGSNAQPPQAKSTPPSALAKAATSIAYKAFKLAIPMIPSPAGDIVSLIVSVGEQIAAIVDNAKANPDKAKALMNKVERLTQIICQLLANRMLEDLPASTEKHLEEILRDLRSVRDIVEKQADQSRWSRTLLALDNAETLQTCDIKMGQAYASLD